MQVFVILLKRQARVSPVIISLLKFTSDSQLSVRFKHLLILALPRKRVHVKQCIFQLLQLDFQVFKAKIGTRISWYCHIYKNPLMENASEKYGLPDYFKNCPQNNHACGYV